MKNSVEMPPMSMTLKARVRATPGSISSHSMSATEARNSSTMMPMAPTRARWVLAWKTEAEEAST